jgi:xanthine/uracil/vitamin C permease (AzgA family)
MAYIIAVNVRTVPVFSCCYIQAFANVDARHQFSLRLGASASAIFPIGQLVIVFSRTRIARKASLFYFNSTVLVKLSWTNRATDMRRDLITATAAIAALSSFIFGLFTNLPVALA